MSRALTGVLLARNFLGAFADAAVLLPLSVTLARTGGMNGAVLLFSAGFAYLAAGWIFRVPMSVQPLKSIAIAGVSLGATGVELRWAGFLTGLFCLCLALSGLDRWASRVPMSVIHSIQLGLGVLLMVQGSKAAFGFSAAEFSMTIAFLLLILLGPRVVGFPFLGFLATCGVLYCVLRGGHVVAPSWAGAPPSGSPRVAVLVALVLPQFALTAANSVLGTQNVASQYFPENSGRVTARRLLVSIGLGNVLFSGWGGLPFCHGSGGVTAHVRGGASHWVMNVFAGISFMALAAVTAVRGTLTLPGSLIASLLISVGISHLFLARESWMRNDGKLQLAATALVTLVTQNLLAALAVSCVIETFKRTRRFQGKEAWV
jgi:MFS superfamily sulfate permease-like transporter